MQWIMIHEDIYWINTPEEIAEAQAALHEHGLTQAEVWVGDPESPEASDTYKNGRILFA
jgi:hypothetical protein